MSAEEGGWEGLEEKFEWCVWCNNKHHALNEKHTCDAFAPKTTIQQPCSVVAWPAKPHSDLMTCWAWKWMEISKVWKNATLVDFTVWFLEGLWGTAIHSGEQCSYVGQLVSTDQNHLLSLCVMYGNYKASLSSDHFPSLYFHPLWLNLWGQRSSLTYVSTLLSYTWLVKEGLYLRLAMLTKAMLALCVSFLFSWSEQSVELEKSCNQNIAPCVLTSTCLSLDIPVRACWDFLLFHKEHHGINCKCFMFILYIIQGKQHLSLAG